MSRPSGSVTVIIPCFDAEATLATTIESVLAQDGVELGIIIIDDGSTDNSLAVARAFKPALQIVTGPNRGASAARNRGIGETTGEWVVFLDSDDLLLPGTLRARLNTAEMTDADVVVCDWQELTDTDDGPVDGPVRSVDRVAIEADAEIACATDFWATTAALMYRRSLVEKIGGFRADLPIIQDARLLFDAAHHGARFAYSQHVGARYRVSQRSLSRRDPESFWRDVLTNGRQIEALWRARGGLSPMQREALAGIFNNAARGLFAAGSRDYFDAVDCQRGLGGQLPFHPRIAAPLARVVGLWPARQILGLVGR